MLFYFVPCSKCFLRCLPLINCSQLTSLAIDISELSEGFPTSLKLKILLKIISNFPEINRIALWFLALPWYSQNFSVVLAILLKILELHFLEFLWHWWTFSFVFLTSVKFSRHPEKLEIFQKINSRYILETLYAVVDFTELQLSCFHIILKALNFSWVSCTDPRSYPEVLNVFLEFHNFNWSAVDFRKISGSSLGFIMSFKVQLICIQFKETALNFTKLVFFTSALWSPISLSRVLFIFLF